MDIAHRIATQLKIGPEQVSTTIRLLDSKNTVPFLARYRKEATGGLDESQLRDLNRLLESLRTLEKRRRVIVRSITENGELSEKLHQKLLAATTLTELEDLYQPFKPKRKTRASVARKEGLLPLANLILAQEIDGGSPDEIAIPFLNDKIDSTMVALAGARDIVAENISDHPDVRKRTRELGYRWGILSSQKTSDAQDSQGTFKLYYDFKGPISRLKPYQVLALNRGESESILRLSIEIAERDWRKSIAPFFPINPRCSLAFQLDMAIVESAKRLLIPAIKRDLRRILTKQAEEHAISVFAKNLHNLLLQPPLSGYTVLGIDPGYQSGCKLAVVSPTGNVLDTSTIYPHAPQKEKRQAKEVVVDYVKHFNVGLVAIGNGTASRETEQLVAELIKEFNLDRIKYLMTNEAGASVYSASRLARSELPNLDVTLRGAVSIARRVQDPLAEYVKIDPRSIGVGLYQHDIDQSQLRKALDEVVESAVNQVGIDVNTASPALLTHIAGIGPKLAENIVAYRDEKGPLSNRQSLLNVLGLGPKSYEQAAGFLRILNGSNPLDASAIHPESYSIAERILEMSGLNSKVSLLDRKHALSQWRNQSGLKKLSSETGAGIPTIKDILDQLLRPGRDPREDLPAPILRNDVLKMEDLKSGMQLMGTVRNVVDFGAFVDIGVKQDGLLHRSQLPRSVAVGVGDVIEVKVIKVEPERGRISLGWVG